MANEANYGSIIEKDKKTSSVRWDSSSTSSHCGTRPTWMRCWSNFEAKDIP